MSLHPTTEFRLARAGMVLLVLSPFSLVSFTLQSLIALASLLLPARRGTQHRIQGAKAWSRLLVWMLVIGLLSLLGSILSIADLIVSGRAGLVEIIARSTGQQLALGLGFFQVLCGFCMSRHYGDQVVRRAVILPFIVIMCVATYQLIAIAVGLPYLGKFVDDRFVGLRPSSLAVEPKYLAGYLACLIFYLGYRFFETSIKGKFVLGIGFLSALYFFVATASGNGALITVLLLALCLLVLPLRWRLILAVSGLLGLQFVIAGFDVERLGLRETHKDLIANINSIDLSLLDDLIVMPILAWLDNPLKVVLGFGPGLMHFFAAQYTDYATWWTAGTYIEGNVSLLMYASNLGLVLYGLLLILITLNAASLVRRPPPGIRGSTAFFFACSFLAGAVIAGNISVPLFVSIGWILGIRMPRSPRQRFSRLSASQGVSPL